MAIDRIESIDYELSIDYEQNDFDADEYYKNTYGVTVLDDNHSQRFVERQKDGSVILTLRVHNNFEIQRRLLGYGDGIEILKPRRLRGQIKKILGKAFEGYE